MNTSALLVSSQDRIMTLTLNRPEKCNALDGDLVDQLRNAFYLASKDAQISAILLNSSGKHFCAGADLTWMQQLAQGSFEMSRDDAQNLSSLLYTMYLFQKPIVTVVRGSTRGGGLGLLACSDIVLASSEADFCFSEVKMGLAPAVISPYIISIFGERLTRYYFLSAEKFNAPEAQSLGLVQKVLPQEELETAALNQLKALLKNSPQGLAEVKRLLPQVSKQEISLELIEKMAEVFARLRVSEQVREGLNAFCEKRPPTWERKT